MAAMAPAASTMPGSVSGSPIVISSGTRPAMTGCNDAGTDNVTSPAPVRNAALPARSAAPAQSREPHTASSDPNVPLWPSAGRSGRNAATRPASSRMAVGDRVSDRLTARRQMAASSSPTSGSGRGQLQARTLQLAKPAHAGEDLALAVVQPCLDVDREHERATEGADAEGDGDRVLLLVADGHRDALHAQLVGATESAIVELDRRLPRGQSHDLDLAPADSPDTQPEHLAHGLLGRPATGQVLRPVTDVGAFCIGQDPLREPVPETGQRLPDPIDLDDVDAQLGRARGGLHQRPVPGAVTRRSRTWRGCGAGRRRCPGRWPCGRRTAGAG